MRVCVCVFHFITNTSYSLRAKLVTQWRPASCLGSLFFGRPYGLPAISIFHLTAVYYLQMHCCLDSVKVIADSCLRRKPAAV